MIITFLKQSTHAPNKSMSPAAWMKRSRRICEIDVPYLSGDDIHIDVLHVVDDVSEQPRTVVCFDDDLGVCTLRVLLDLNRGLDPAPVCQVVLLAGFNSLLHVKRSC